MGSQTRDLYGDHIHICAHTYTNLTPGESRVAPFSYTSLHAVSRRSPLLTDTQKKKTHTPRLLHISMSCFLRHLDQREVLQPVDDELLPPSPGSLSLSLSFFSFFFQKSHLLHTSPQSTEIKLLKTHQRATPVHCTR